MAKTKIQPGQQLERDFASWMESRLDYTRTELNKRISPGSTAYEIDVYGTRRDPRSERAARIGALVYLGLVIAAAAGWSQVEQTLIQAMAFIAPELSGYASLIAVAGGGLAYVYGMKRIETRAFVECKDLQNAVGRPVVMRLVGCMNTIGKAELREEGREEWMLVSGNGFTGPAREAAAEHGIKCFSRHGHGFTQETL